MSISSTEPRIVRGSPPSGKLNEKNYRRRALPSLKRDFRDRCAYSMQHMNRAGGEKCLEVDHFDPTLTGSKRHRYSNLFLASRHCNGAKSDNWPTSEERRQGLRFLNCCKDVDYGVHIKEDSQNHKLVGLTPAGKYHITVLDLNADHLVKERKDRADFLRELDSPLIIKNGKDISDLKTLFDKLKQQIDEMIPTIPYV